MAARLGVEWVEISIQDDEVLTQRYQNDIPVTLVDGKVHDFWRVSAERLTQALAG